MNRNRFGLSGCVLMVAVAVCSPSSWAQESIRAVSSGPVAGPKISVPEIEPEVETGSWMVGTRLTRFSLQDDKRGSPNKNSFMGSVYKLKEEDNDTPNKLFVQYRLVESLFWVGVSYDHVRASAWDNGGTDGTIDLEGLVPFVQARWENDTRAVPYVEAGLAFYEVSFDESSGWSDDGQRSVKLDDRVTGMEIAGGVAVQVYEGWSVDFYAQYMNVEDITGTWYDFGEPFGDVIFTMSHTTYGVGVQVQF